VGGDASLGGFGEKFAGFLSQTHQAYKGGSYGLGWNVTRAPPRADDPPRLTRKEGQLFKLSHSGAFQLGASTDVLLLPDDRLGVAVLTNGEPTGVPEGLCEAFRRLAGDPSETAETLETKPRKNPVRLGSEVPLLEVITELMSSTMHPPPRSRLRPRHDWESPSPDPGGNPARLPHSAGRRVLRGQLLGLLCQLPQLGLELEMSGSRMLVALGQYHLNA
jgi:hypothetical protein